MNLKSITVVSSFVFCALIFSYCAWKLPNGSSAATPAPSVAPSPTPELEPYLGYLHEGNLRIVRADGAEARLLAAAPTGEAIQDFVWSQDGARCYYAVGSRFFDVALDTGNLASAGELLVPPGVSVDRLELARDGHTIIVHALDADAASRRFAVTIGQREARELSVDEYSDLTIWQPAVVRRVGDLSVSPDGHFVLFKEAVGAGEELYVAEIETGVRWQISSLGLLEGFEPTAELTGGRYVLEATWSPDGRYVIFNPAQSCSETGLCYGRLFLVSMWGGPQLQLSLDMLVSLPAEWQRESMLLAYDDGSDVVLSNAGGQARHLAEGHHPKWQPEPTK